MDPDNTEPNPDLEHINPLLHRAVEAITAATAQSFDAIWSRPDAARTVELFLDGEIVFVVHRDEVQVRRAVEEPPARGTGGGYL